MRVAGGTLGLVAVALVGWAVSAAAQYPEPRPFPNVPSTPIGPRFIETEEPPLVGPGRNDALPPLVVEDPNVEPAQFTRPASVVPGLTATAPVADPPPPVVRIQVRVPADSPPEDDIKYLITVTNASQAEAHQVVIRNPVPDGCTPVRAEPQWDAKLSTANQLYWVVGTLKPGEKKTVELFLKPKPGAAEVRNLAYVRFEHGEAVTTRLNRPGLRVTKTAPKQSVRDEPFTVRVMVENTGRVPADAVRVVEDIDRGAEVETVTAGARRTRQDENQYVWEIPRLLPGERRVIEYRVTPRQAKESLTTTAVAAAKNIQEKAESRTAVLVPGLHVKLTGPSGVVGPGEAARYEITVRNTGTLPSTNLTVVGTIPADCKLTMKTEGGQIYRDQITWTLPRLEPGDAQSFRFAIRAGTTGNRAVAANVQDSRKTRASDKTETLFEGTAALRWDTIPNPAALAVGRQGTFTVKVRNGGGEAARNVRVEVELPAEVSLVQATPNVRPEGRVLKFAPEVIDPSRETVYTITYRAEQSAQAWFKVRMTADALGERPILTEKAVEITGGGK
jgi:uncharacterized repeat protein (TIGR01451 family)